MSTILTRGSLSLAGRPDCIRLLKILPGDDSDHIRCSLSVQNISSRSFDYTTGSYMWGSRANPKVIYVDGKQFIIRQRLWAFLHYLRRQGKGSAIEVWIDAICISQDDPEEKAQQIRLMSTIYGKAEKTIAWLDEDDKEIHLAFDVIKQRACQTRDWYRFGISMKELSESEWKAIIKLVKHQHFTRRWIIQETMLPPTLTLQCGNRSLPWTHVESFLSTFSLWERQDRWLQVDQSIFRRLWTDRSKLHEHHGGLRLPDLLHRYRDTVCKKKCDEINAFLGLVENGHSLYCDEHSTELYNQLMAASKRRYSV